MSEQSERSSEIENKKEPTLTRSQRRMRDRIEKQASDTYRQLTAKFFDYFIKHDNPESQEIIDRIDQISTQWRMYCRKMNLIKDVYYSFESYALGLLKEYQESKEIKA